MLKTCPWDDTPIRKVERPEDDFMGNYICPRNHYFTSQFLHSPQEPPATAKKQLQEETKMVNFDEYTEAKPGAKEETEITEIKEGLREDFVSEEYWAAVKDKESIPAQRKQKVIEIVCKNGAKTVMSLPEGKVLSPKSNLSLFKNTYNSFPKVGMKITTKTDDQGFNKIVLEK